MAKGKKLDISSITKDVAKEANKEIHNQTGGKDNVVRRKDSTKFKTIRLRIDAHRRLKIEASLKGILLSELIDKIIDTHLDG